MLRSGGSQTQTSVKQRAAVKLRQHISWTCCYFLRHQTRTEVCLTAGEQKVSSLLRRPAGTSPVSVLPGISTELLLWHENSAPLSSISPHPPRAVATPQLPQAFLMEVRAVEKAKYGPKRSCGKSQQNNWWSTAPEAPDQWCLTGGASSGDTKKLQLLVSDADGC